MENKKRILYFKPTNKTHDSGFNYIEYGYCDMDDKGNAVNIQRVNKYDVFFWRGLDLHIDLTPNGYFRILNDNYKWDYSGRLTKT